MSLPQMRNLRFQFDLQPDKAFLSSPILGIENMQLRVAPSSHLVLDLIDLSEYMWHVRFCKFKKSSFLTYYLHYEYGFHQKTTGSSSLEEAPEELENLVFATDDEWVLDENKMELIRVHKKMRQSKYEPKNGHTPIWWSSWTTRGKRSWNSPRKRSALKKMIVGPLSAVLPRLLTTGEVGPSLGFCMEV